VFNQHDSRFDLLTIRRRGLTTRDVQPVKPFQHVFEAVHVYGAVALTTGEHFLVELPDLDIETFRR
jgi:hypothetical protein